MNRPNAIQPRRQSQPDKLASLKAKVRRHASTRQPQAPLEAATSYFDFGAGRNFNTMVLGRSGSGKSVLLSEIVSRITGKENPQ